MAKKKAPPKEDQHPFQVGKQYRNRDGEYHVIRIHEPNMTIRYLDGRIIESSIMLQARIWENIQDSNDHDAAFEVA